MKKIKIVALFLIVAMVFNLGVLAVPLNLNEVSGDDAQAEAFAQREALRKSAWEEHHDECSCASVTHDCVDVEAILRSLYDSLEIQNEHVEQKP